VPREQAVGPFGDAGKDVRAFIPIDEPILLGIVGERTEDGLGAAINAAIRLDQLHGVLELPAGHFGKAHRYTGVLEREINKVIPGGMLPTVNPQRAEVAAAVIDH
jgi:hypothetical protein